MDGFCIDGDHICYDVEVDGRCPMSGYPERIKRTVRLTLGEAETLVNMLPGYIDRLRHQQKTAKARRVAELEAELRTLRNS